MIRRSRVVSWRMMLGAACIAAACGGAARLDELQKVRSGTLDVVLLSPHAALRHGKDEFVLEFRTSDGTLVDVGDVKATASMPMPGMPMFGSIAVRKTDVAGRYRADAEFSMAGTWRLAIEWDGPNGKGAVAFSGSVQ